MKILKVRIQNLNSLRGEWFIDFTAKEYVSEGLFLISGPTGSGKTTILDAICLALYGKTPRLSSITAANNEIISRNARECLAEVVFEAGNARYGCVWSQAYRQRKKGELDNPKHRIFQISDSGTEKEGGNKADAREVNRVLEEKYRASLRRVEEITRLDFTQFTRAIMLAQGDFDAFLKAGETERGDILEKITGNDIFRKISIRSYEKWDEASKKLDDLKRELDRYAPLDAMAENELNNRLKQIGIETERQDGLIARYREALGWRQNLDKLEKARQSKEREKEMLNAEISRFAPRKNQLDAARRARALDGVWQNLLSLRNRLASVSHNLGENETRERQLRNSLNNLAGECQRLEASLDAEEKKLETARPKFAKTREIKKAITDKKEICTQNEKALAASREELDKDAGELARAINKKQDKNAELENINLWLERNRGDENLADLLGQIEDRARDLRKRKKELAAKNDALLQSARELARANTALESAALAREKCGLDHTRAEQELEKARRALVDLNLSLNLEELRKRLVENQPCPLCGALHHPYSETPPAVKESPEMESGGFAAMSAEINRREGLAEQRETELKALAGKLKKAENDEAEQKIAASNAKNRHDLINGQLGEMMGEIRSRENELLVQMGKFFPDGTAPGFMLDRGIEALRERRDHWKQAFNARIDLERELGSLIQQVKNSENLLEVRKERAEKDRNILAASREQLANLENELMRNYGDIDPDAGEKKLENSVQALRTQKNELEKRKSEVEQKLSGAQSSIRIYKKDYEENAPELKRQETAFARSLAESAFASESEFAASRLDERERKKLEEESESLKNRQDRLNAELENCLGELKREQDRNLSAESLESLQKLKVAAETASRELERELGGIRQRLEENAKKKLEAARILRAMEAQGREERRYRKLKDLIGKRDGAEFVKIAQDITFGILINSANRQMEKLSDRYQLVHDTSDSAKRLVLKIQDNYQGGEIRSTDNLSGGEKFMASLALALGLSRMAGGNTRIDSLFLDEGFGTLDENTLDAAMNTLAGLRQEGKLIGIISHVAALRESVATKIEVRPGSGGDSEISGPGCGAIKRL